MDITPLGLEGLLLIQLDMQGDHRGFFVERFNVDRFRAAGLPATFVQDNQSRSRPGVLRGLHYQHTPAQGKLVGVTRGRIYDAVADIRAGSPTFGRTYATELSDMNGRLLWIPAGFAHGFAVLGDSPADLVYKVDAPYSARGEGGILWNDTRLAIDWPIDDPVVSDRDRTLQTLDDYERAPAFQ